MTYGTLLSTRARTTLLALLLATAGLAPAAAQAPAAKELTWKVQSTWPQANLLHELPLIMAKAIDEMSGGRLKMNVMAAGMIVPPFEVLDAVHKNVLDAAHSWPGYWTGKNMAAGLFGPPPAGPFGLGRDEFLSWLHVGGGIELYNELLQKELKLNVVAFFTTTLCYWEAFGWFRKPFESLADLRKMKFRTSGLGPADAAQHGRARPCRCRAVRLSRPSSAAPSTAPSGQSRATTYSWDSTTSPNTTTCPTCANPRAVQEFLINKTKWDELPADLKAIVKNALLAEIMRMNNASIDLESKAADRAGREARRKDHAHAGRGAQGTADRQSTRCSRRSRARTRSSPRFSRRSASLPSASSRMPPRFVPARASGGALLALKQQLRSRPEQAIQLRNLRMGRQCDCLFGDRADSAAPARPPVSSAAGWQRRPRYPEPAT